MTRIDLQRAKGKGYAGEVFRLAGPSVLVGRADECGLRLDSDVTSRRHATLHFTGGRWVVEDHRSRNGTFLNGLRIGVAVLRAGDLLRFGRDEPAYRVAALEPPFAAAPADVRARVLRPPAAPADPRPEDIPTLQPLPGSAPGSRPVSRPVSRPPSRTSGPTREVIATPPDHGRRALSVVTSLVGIAFALLTAGRVWAESRFPYESVTTPVDWLLTRISRLDPEPFAKLAPWPQAALLAVEFGLLGLTLARPLRRMPWTLLLVGAHVAAALLILDPGR